MPIDASHLWRQIALGEDTELELKEARFRGDRVARPRRDDLADGLAALANGRGGRLVLGVTDERQPQGIEPAQLDALADLVTEICSDSVKPPLDFSLFRVSAPGPAGGGALVVEVPEGATVHRSPGGHFRRRGNRKRLMDAAEVRRLAQAPGAVGRRVQTMPRATTQVIDRRRQHGQAEYSPHARTRLASDGRIPRCSRDRR